MIRTSGPAPAVQDARRAAARAARAGGAGIAAMLAAVRRAVAAAPGWVGGALAGVQGALLSLAIVLVPVWVITSAAAHSDVSWGESSVAATRLWLMAFGGTWVLNGTALTLAPLGVTALAALMLVPLARLFGSASPVTGVAAVAAFTATVTAAHGLTAAHGGPGDTVAVATWSAVVAVPAVAWGLLRKEGVAMPWMARVPVHVRAAARAALGMALGVICLAATGLAVSAILGRQAIAQAAGALSLDVPGGVAFAAAETAYAPTLTGWMVAWGSGAGFSWAGVQASSAHPLEATLPPIPLLGALPHASGGILAYTPVLFVLVGAAVTVALRARWGRGVGALLAPVGAAVVAGALLGVGAQVTRGAAGPGSLASVGPDAVMTGLLSGAWLAVGAIVAGGALVFLSDRATATAPPAVPRSAS